MGGEFTVPEGADGTYQISFTAIIDTLKDTTDNRAPAKFVFATKQARGSFIKMEATTLSASAGHPGQDKVPASRSILLDLKAGEKVAVIQRDLEPRAVTASPSASTSSAQLHLLLGNPSPRPKPLLCLLSRPPTRSPSRIPSQLMTSQSSSRSLK